MKVPQPMFLTFSFTLPSNLSLPPSLPPLDLLLPLQPTNLPDTHCCCSVLSHTSCQVNQPLFSVSPHQIAIWSCSLVPLDRNGKRMKYYSTFLTPHQRGKPAHAKNTNTTARVSNMTESAQPHISTSVGRSLFLYIH